MMVSKTPLLVVLAYNVLLGAGSSLRWTPNGRASDAAEAAAWLLERATVRSDRHRERDGDGGTVEMRDGSESKRGALLALDLLRRKRRQTGRSDSERRRRRDAGSVRDARPSVLGDDRGRRDYSGRLKNESRRPQSANERGSESASRPEVGKHSEDEKQHRSDMMQTESESRFFGSETRPPESESRKTASERGLSQSESTDEEIVPSPNEDELRSFFTETTELDEEVRGDNAINADDGRNTSPSLDFIDVAPRCMTGWQVCASCWCCYLTARTRIFCYGPIVTSVPGDLPINVTHL